MSVIPTLGRPRKKDYGKLEASLGYISEFKASLDLVHRKSLARNKTKKKQVEKAEELKWDLRLVLWDHPDTKWANRKNIF